MLKQFSDGMILNEIFLIVKVIIHSFLNFSIKSSDFYMPGFVLSRIGVPKKEVNNWGEMK